MYKNADFKQLYNERFNFLIQSDLFTAERFNNIVDQYTENIENIIALNIDKYKHPNTLIEWYINISRLKNNFKTREVFVKQDHVQ